MALFERANGRLPESLDQLVTTPRYSGPQKIKLRFKLTLAPDRILHSPVYEGGVHPEQFTAKQGHQPANIMDPYNE